MRMPSKQDAIRALQDLQGGVMLGTSKLKQKWCDGRPAGAQLSHSGAAMQMEGMRVRMASKQDAVRALQDLKGEPSQAKQAWRPRMGQAVRILSMGSSTGKVASCRSPLDLPTQPCSSSCHSMLVS